MKTIKIKNFHIYSDSLDNIRIDCNKQIINTINAHSYVVAKKDNEFEKALISSDVLLPDGEGIVFMAKFLKRKKIHKIAGADIHTHLLTEANSKGLKCFYLGSSQKTLDIIKSKQEEKYPNITFEFYSPPFKSEFTKDENKLMLKKINSFNSDVVFVGMTAPKQEKWVIQNKKFINAKVICSIGAVFDFIAGTNKRAPEWLIQIKMEWLYRALTSWRLTKRYLYSNPLFLMEIISLKINPKRQ